MYNDNNEMYEVHDFDEDIKLREALLQEAKNLQEQENVDPRTVADLKRKWKRISNWDSAYEEKMNEEFEGYLDAFYGKRREEYKNNETKKQELIEKAKSVSASTNWNQATKDMKNLMTEWKSVGSAGRETDDALWEEFNAARQVFFDRKHANWEEKANKAEAARQTKEELIKEAAALCDSNEWQKTSEKYKEMMDRWKAAGNAGKEHEDRLWNEFNETRQKFYDRRNEHYEQLHAEQSDRYNQKKDLVAKAKEIVAANEFSKANTEEMKNLSVEWKKVGSCGKNKEDQIWKEFRSIMDEYFNGLREWNNQKHEQWVQRMQETRSRKQDLIEKQKRQIKHMQQEMNSLLGQRAISEMEESIEDKKVFIQQLEAEVADIEKTLEEN